jgi:hypothetical protein
MSVLKDLSRKSIHLKFALLSIVLRVWATKERSNPAEGIRTARQKVSWKILSKAQA